jgi:hypothetical protein
VSVPEVSGAARSRTHAGVVWWHGDSGTPARLYATRLDGTPLATYDVEGVANVDWEDLALDGEGRLWISDTGNNANERRDLRLMRVAEPAPDGPGGALTPELVIGVRYPDQTEFPPEARNFDAEALAILGDRPYLFSKHRADTKTTVYRLPAIAELRSGQALVAERIAEFDVGGADRPFGGMVTGADVSGDGRHLALLTYHAVFVFPLVEAGDDPLAAAPVRVDLRHAATNQVEAITWDGADVLIANEDGWVFRIVDPVARRPARFPAD